MVSVVIDWLKRNFVSWSLLNPEVRQICFVRGLTVNISSEAVASHHLITFFKCFRDPRCCLAKLAPSLPNPVMHGIDFLITLYSLCHSFPASSVWCCLKQTKQRVRDQDKTRVKSGTQLKGVDSAQSQAAKATLSEGSTKRMIWGKFLLK